MLREGGNDGRYLVRLVDAFGQAATGAAVEKRDGQAQNMAKGRLNELEFDFTGHNRALVFRQQRKVVSNNADRKQSGSRPQQSDQSLRTGAGRHDSRRVDKAGVVFFLDLLRVPFLLAALSFRR